MASSTPRLRPPQEKLAALEPAPLAEQRKLVTVLSADVLGFAPSSEWLDAEDVSDLMNALWQPIDVVILEHGGYIDKHVGDVVVTLWASVWPRRAFQSGGILGLGSVQAQNEGRAGAVNQRDTSLDLPSRLGYTGVERWHSVQSLEGDPGRH
jgi:class 3 adenylate cyclase